MLAKAGAPGDRSPSLGWNAAHVKNVPGSKTDVNDVMWLANLTAHGLIRASFVPEEPTQQMRDLPPTRKEFVGERSGLAATMIVAEIGIEMSRFKTDAHLIRWAGLCPKSDKGAGKRRSNPMKNGAPWLKTTLIQCAWAASRTKGSYLQTQYLRIRSRCGPKKAIGAVAASLLTAAYHVLKDGTLYQYLGPNHFDTRAKGKHVLRLVKRLHNLGFDVQITPLAA